MNNFYGYPYGNNYGGTNYYTQPQTQQQPLTNKIYVTSAEDALSRFASPNTVTAYFLQDESAVFEVTTDIQGKKNLRVRKLTDVAEETKKQNIPVDYVTREEFDDFRTKLEKAMGATAKIKKKEVINDDEQ